MKNKRLNVGVIGCGWIMRAIYSPVLLSLQESVQVAAVCDLNETAAKGVAEPFAGATVFTDVEAMLRDAKLDAVMVLTSEKVNAAMAQRVLKTNLPVYLEKPPAISTPQLEELIAAEALSRIFVYTAFNRRHVPLFSRINFSGAKLLRVFGALRRMNRAVTSFPHTSVHLIDAAQYYAESLFQNWNVAFGSNGELSRWTIEGRFQNGAACALKLVPTGPDFAEFLIFETETERWKLQFPNNEATVPEGEIIVTRRDGTPVKTTKGDKAMPFFEAMGFRACLENFCHQLETRNNSAHRLTSCLPTIAIMEEMEARARS